MPTRNERLTPQRSEHVLLGDWQPVCERCFLVHEREEVVEREVGEGDARRKQEALHNNDGNEPDPYRGGKRHEPDPQSAAYRVGGEGGTERAGDQVVLLEEIRDDRYGPEEREVPHFAPDGVGDKRDNGEDGNDHVHRHFASEVDGRHHHRKEADERAHVAPIGSLEYEVRALHEKHGGGSRKCSQKSTRRRAESVEDGEFHA